MRSRQRRRRRLERDLVVGELFLELIVRCLNGVGLSLRRVGTGLDRSLLRLQSPNLRLNLRQLRTESVDQLLDGRQVGCAYAAATGHLRLNGIDRTIDQNGHLVARASSGDSP